MALYWYSIIIAARVPEGNNPLCQILEVSQTRFAPWVRTIHGVAFHHGPIPTSFGAVIGVIGFGFRARPPPGFKPVSSIGVPALSNRRLEIV